MCEKWGLSASNINAVVTDNAPNMVAAVRALPVEPPATNADESDDEEIVLNINTDADESGNVIDAAGVLDEAIALTEWGHLRCIAHTINLVVQDGVKSIESIRTKLRSVVGYFHRSSKGADTLKNKQKLLHPLKQPLALLMEVSTRWNSTFKMLERVHDVKDSLVSAIAELNECAEVSRGDLDVVEQVIKVLKPFDEVTEELSAEKYVSASKVIVLVASLKKFLAGVIADKTNKWVVTEMASKMKKNLDDRYGMLEGQSALAMSTFLDPRFKVHGFQNAAQVAKVKRNVERAVSQINANDEQCVALPAQSTEATLWKEFDRKQAALLQTSSSGSLEVRQYMEDAPALRSSDPLLYWKNHEQCFPRLAMLAKRHLSLVATSVPVERVFSTAGQLVSARRSRLTPEHVEMVMFMNKNIAHF